MCETYGLYYSPYVSSDLASIYRYVAYSLKAGKYALDQLNRILDGIHGLSTLPERFSLVDFEPMRSAGVRKMPVDRFVVYYSVDRAASAVTIIRVLYGGRNAKDILTTDPDAH